MPDLEHSLNLSELQFSFLQNGDENPCPLTELLNHLNAWAVEWAQRLPPSLARPDVPAGRYSPTRVGKTSSSLMRPSIQSMSKAI